MPTARELLEQADALMRRNRTDGSVSRVIHAIPVPAPGSTRAAEHGAPAAPRRDALAIPTDMRLDAMDDGEVPVLTEVIDALPDERALLPEDRGATPEDRGATPEDLDSESEDLNSASADRAALDDSDDVPVLTDAIEEIEAAPPVEDWGEPSLFFDLEHGEGSILGSPQHSVIAVPQVIATHSADHGTAALDEPIRTIAQSADEASGMEAELLASATLPSQPPTDETTVADGTAWPPELDRKVDDEEVDAVLDLDRAVGVLPPPMPEAQPAAAARDSSDDGRWSALAEEIGMQVLQRIDLFTDTGLRDQLGERLKPIVDRASADLVATINQHVGDLLRAYVAEAIEREIERWRSEGH